MMFYKELPDDLNADMVEEASKRFWLAGLAMQALVRAGHHDVVYIAQQSFTMANAMMEVEGDVRFA